MSYASELQQDYAERRKRLFNPGVKPPEPSIVRRPYNPTIWHKRKRDVLVIASETAEASAPMFDVIDLPPAAWKVIVMEVCEKHRITYRQIIGDCRSRHIVAARHEAFYRLSTEATLSLTAIGHRMGGKDHTTVIHGIAKHRERMAAAAEVAA